MAIVGALPAPGVSSVLTPGCPKRGLAVGMDCCMLNLSATSSRADALREESGMPVSEVPIMMMAIGHGATDRRVARSPRLSLSEVLVTARR